MSYILQQEGIESGKLFAKPGWFSELVPDFDGDRKGRVRWKYHVAPFVYVRKGDQVEQWMFDPAIADRPIPRTEWESFLSRHPDSGLGKIQVTRPFIYRPSHVHDDTKGFKGSELRESRDILDRANSIRFRQIE